MKFQVDNEDTGNRDIYGGLITEENAFFTMLSVMLDDDQPLLKDMKVGDKQRRAGATADSKKLRNKQPGKDPHQRPMIYAVWRME